MAGKETVPKNELGQIGPHSDPNGDAAFVSSTAGQMNGGGHTVSGTSYEAMSTSPPDGGASPAPYDTIRFSGQN